MVYIIVFILLFALEICYFSIAKRFNITDKPNSRSSHTQITLRGGGVIFYFGAIFYFFGYGFEYPLFFLGLTLMTLISFLDDVLTLSNKIRLLVHFSSVWLLLTQLNMIGLPWIFLIAIFIVIVGIINAYNFMDGINGMTACYSLSLGILLTISNLKFDFIDQRLLYFLIISIIVFLFYNFRNKAKTFAGDVGAVSIAFVLIFCLASLIFKTQNLIYLLFLLVYGIDTVWTILRRLVRRENIFQAHRSHLYQLLANEAGINKLLVSFFYGAVQFFIGILVLEFDDASLSAQLWFAFLTIVSISAVYVLAKEIVIRKYRII